MICRMEDKKKYTYTAELVQVLDGDRVRLILRKRFFFDIDLGFYIKDTLQTVKTVEMEFRLYGITAPEERSDDAKRQLKELLSLGAAQARTYPPDDNGDWLVDIYIFPEGKEPVHVNEEMIRSGVSERHVI